MNLKTTEHHESLKPQNQHNGSLLNLNQIDKNYFKIPNLATMLSLFNQHGGKEAILTQWENMHNWYNACGLNTIIAKDIIESVMDALKDCKLNFYDCFNNIIHIRRKYPLNRSIRVWFDDKDNNYKILIGSVYHNDNKINTMHTVLQVIKYDAAIITIGPEKLDIQHTLTCSMANMEGSYKGVQKIIKAKLDWHVTNKLSAFNNFYEKFTEPEIQTWKQIPTKNLSGIRYTLFVKQCSLDNLVQIVHYIEKNQAHTPIFKENNN